MAVEIIAADPALAQHRDVVTARAVPRARAAAIGATATAMSAVPDSAGASSGVAPPTPPAGALLSHADLASELAAYQRRLYDIVARNSRYPSEAKGVRLAGVTELAFRLGRDGGVIDRWIQTSSGSALLDTAALAALDRAQPLPPIPADLPAQLEFAVQIDAATIQRGIALGG